MTDKVWAANSGSRKPDPSFTGSGPSGFDPGRMTDEELANAAAKLRKRADLQMALELADLSVARFEPPSEAVDRQFDRNLAAMSRISQAQRLVRDEIERRRAQVETLNGN